MTAEYEAWFANWWHGKMEGSNYRRAKALGWEIWQSIKGVDDESCRKVR